MCWAGSASNTKLGQIHAEFNNVMFQAALVAAHHNPTMKAFGDRLRKAGKPHKVIITAVARKLVNLANALCKNVKNGCFRNHERYSC